MNKFILLFLFATAVLSSAAQNNSFNITFDFNSSRLTPAAIAGLDSFMATTQTIKMDFRIQLTGHCDFIGNNAYNDAVSIKRVTAVKEYFIAKGLAATTISMAKGYGKRKPLNDNTTEEERRQNRRVEIMMRFNNEPAGETSISEQLEDTAVKAGSNLILKNINFVGGRHQVLAESFPVLLDLLKALQKNKNLVVQVQGHICCLPGNVDGVDLETGAGNLSEVRAKTVVDFLVKNGIAASRLSYIGFGHTQPLFNYPEKSEAERVLNRRVELKIISK
jgi:outer membrane protein OmpA-like peptidoglycan-associated protein